MINFTLSESLAAVQAYCVAHAKNLAEDFMADHGI